jgi:multiple sugar transport system permease protein
MPDTASRNTIIEENWGTMMAASIVVSIPVTLMFIFLQRYFIQGLTSGAVKG